MNPIIQYHPLLRQDFKGSDSEGEKGADETLTKLGGLEVRGPCRVRPPFLGWFRGKGVTGFLKMYENDILTLIYFEHIMWLMMIKRK